jgi:hypothetical protein
MKIELSEEQYLSLVKLVYLGRLMSTYVDESGEGDKELNATEQHVYSFFKNFGADECIEFSAKHKAYYPTRPFEESLEPFIEAYDDRRFWEELEDRLAARDLVDQLGAEKAEKLSFEERFKLMESIAQKYEEEFIDNGARRLYLRTDEKGCSDPDCDHHHH